MKSLIKRIESVDKSLDCYIEGFVAFKEKKIYPYRNKSERATNPVSFL
jgi:hypothetical protein